MTKDLVGSFDYGVSSTRYTSGDQWGLKPYGTIWASEVQVACGASARWGNTEAGGELYGLLSHAGRPVIMLATPPGPNAIHEVARFTQDMNFFRKVDAYLRNAFGLCYLGNYHSHHTLNIKGPSLGDIRSTHAIASTNGYQRFAQFVQTFENNHSYDCPSDDDQAYGKTSLGSMTEAKGEGGGLKNLCAKVKARFAPSRPFNFIRIHSFVYLDAARGEPIRCPIRILQGTSPFRRAIERNTLIPELAKPQYSFPMSRILFDSFEPPAESGGDDDLELPAKISNQWLRLPETVQKDTRATFTRGMIVLSLPLPAKGRLFVAYNDKPPYRIEVICCDPNGQSAKPIIITQEALCFGPHTELVRIYERVVRLAEKRDSPLRSNESGRTNEEVTSQKGCPAEEKPVNEGEESKHGGEIS